MSKLRPVYLALLLCAIIVARSPLFQSLWLDETMTVWAAQGNVDQTLQRSLATIPHSPLYFLVAKLSLSLPGPLELAVRLPSLIACAVAAWLIFLVAGGGSTGALAMALFVSSEAVMKATFSARPYALALAFGVIVLWCVERFLLTGSVKTYAYATLAAVLCFYVAYPFGLVFIPVAALLLSQKGGRRLTLPFLALLLLIVPGLMHLATVFQSRASVRFALPPTAIDFLTTLVPSPVLICAAVALVLAPILSKAPLSKALSGLKWEGVDLRFALWWLTPPLLLFAFSKLSDSSLFLDRYFLLYAAGIAPCIARCIGKLPHASSIASVCIVVLIGQQAVHQWVIEDWRSAINEAAQTGDPLLMSSGYFEASRWNRPLSEFQYSYLLSPLSPYPAPNPVAPILPRSSPREQEDEARVALSTLRSPETLGVICLIQNQVAKDAPATTATKTTTLCGKAGTALMSLGFRQLIAKSFGQVQYERWTRLTLVP